MPRMNKKQLEVVNVEDDEDYITARNVLSDAKPEDKPVINVQNTPPEEKPEEQPEINVQNTPPEEKTEEKTEDKPEDILENKPEDKPEDKPAQQKYDDKTVEDRIACPDCGRLVSKKTLRYTHKYQCPGKTQQNIKKQKVEQPPAKEPPISEQATPTKPTLMQSRRAPQRRYEHINLF